MNKCDICPFSNLIKGKLICKYTYCVLGDPYNQNIYKTILKILKSKEK